MKAILIDAQSQDNSLYLGETAMPAYSEQQVLLRVQATALNRADLLQREGKYPPPPGASEILGLEAAGEYSGAGRTMPAFSSGR